MRKGRGAAGLQEGRLQVRSASLEQESDVVQGEGVRMEVWEEVWEGAPGAGGTTR